MSLDTQISDLATAVGNKVKTKQDTLISGTNIKTINGASILGTGNINISGSGGTQNVFIQSTEPVVGTGEKALWIDTTGGNLNFWIKTGD